MILTNTGKKFVYASVIMMILSMVLPWDSLEDYTYSESMGLLMNVIPTVIFICAVAIVVLKPLALLLSKIGTNIVFTTLSNERYRFVHGNAILSRYLYYWLFFISIICNCFYVRGYLQCKSS